MNRKILAIIILAIGLPLAVYIFFNWPTTPGAGLHPNVFIIIMAVLICSIPAYYGGEWIHQKYRLKTAQSLTTTRLKKALKQEQRERNARECLNRFRKSDSYLMACNGQEMEVISRESSPFRDDAVQLELFAFTTSEQYSVWNPVQGIEGIPSEFIFYVIVNCHTGETYFRRFEDYEEAVKHLNTMWKAGVKEIKASVFEKEMLKGAAGELGKITAQKGTQEDKEKDEDG